MPGKKMDPLKKMHDSAMKKLHAAGAAMKKYHTAAKKMHDSAMKKAHAKSPAKNMHYGKKK